MMLAAHSREDGMDCCGDVHTLAPMWGTALFSVSAMLAGDVGPLGSTSAAMLRDAFAPEEAGKIAGGNYVRIFRATVN
jgi:hypothetical protein